MERRHTGSASLRLVQGAGAGAAAPSESFCSSCGEASARAGLGQRVCNVCEMGVLLTAPAGGAPRPGDPFLVIDRDLSVGALSRAAEELLAIGERIAINRHVGELLVLADVEEPKDSLAALLSWAARGEVMPRTIAVRPALTFGVRLWARVATCGPPPAALVVLAPTREQLDGRAAPLGHAADVDGERAAWLRGFADVPRATAALTGALELDLLGTAVMACLPSRYPHQISLVDPRGLRSFEVEGNPFALAADTPRVVSVPLLGADDRPAGWLRAIAHEREALGAEQRTLLENASELFSTELERRRAPAEPSVVGAGAGWDRGRDAICIAAADRVRAYYAALIEPAGADHLHLGGQSLGALPVLRLPRNPRRSAAGRVMAGGGPAFLGGAPDHPALGREPIRSAGATAAHFLPLGPTEAPHAVLCLGWRGSLQQVPDPDLLATVAAEATAALP